MRKANKHLLSLCWIKVVYQGSLERKPSITKYISSFILKNTVEYLIGRKMANYLKFGRYVIVPERNKLG